MTKSYEENGIIKYIFALLIFVGCQQDMDVTASKLGSGGLNLSQLSGVYSLCYVVKTGEFGTDLNGMSFLRTLRLSANGTYALIVQLYTGTLCQSGTQAFSYNQSGNFQTGGVMDAPAGATQIILTVTESLLSLSGGTSVGSQWANSFNLYCPGSSFGFSTSSPSQANVSAAHCSHASNPSFSFPTFTAEGSVLYDAFSLDSPTSPSALTTSPISSIFESGVGGNFPTKATLIYTRSGP